MLPGFSCRDLVAVLVKYFEDGVVVCSAYLPHDSQDPPPTTEFEELMRYCKEEHLCLIIGCDSYAHHSAWGGTGCNDRGEALVEFLGASNLQILNRGNEPTFCNEQRLKVIDITMGSFGLLESIMSWKVFSEPYLSNQTHFVHSLGLHTGSSDQEP
jgi:hypothetical protein